jgi:hypothetical protein
MKKVFFCAQGNPERHLRARQGKQAVKSEA